MSFFHVIASLIFLSSFLKIFYPEKNPTCTHCRTFENTKRYRKENNNYLQSDHLKISTVNIEVMSFQLCLCTYAFFK